MNAPLVTRASSRVNGYGKVIVAVDEDVDVRNSESIWWAINYHTQPHRDFRTMRGKVGLAPCSVRPDIQEGLFSALYPDNEGASAVLIDATRKWPYPPVSLPRQAVMERAKELWSELDLGPLDELSAPWFGTATSRFAPELRQAAERAAEGDYFTTGEERTSTRTDTEPPADREQDPFESPTQGLGPSG
jgi:3-polyprenyl-4-hydroxybenzoate decarboxylase